MGVEINVCVNDCGLVSWLEGEDKGLWTLRLGQMIKIFCRVKI